MAPSRRRGTVLTEAEEAIVVGVPAAHLAVPPDDVLGCRRGAIPKLTRSALHRFWRAPPPSCALPYPPPPPAPARPPPTTAWRSPRTPRAAGTPCATPSTA